MSTTGFILLSRDLLDNDLWRMNSDLVRLFVYLLIRANYGSKEYTYQRGSFEITVRKGEFLRSLRKISEDCSYTGNNKLISWSTSRISSMLQTLEDDGRIEILSNSSALGTHIRITNYHEYQRFSSYKAKGLRTDQEQTKNNSNTVKAIKPTTRSNTVCHASTLWDAWLEALSPRGPHPKLTDKRKRVLNALHREQLSQHGLDPTELFKSILKAVKGSSHHMGTRAYQLPESLFRNQERRESWTHRGLALDRSAPQSSTVNRTWSVDQ